MNSHRAVGAARRATALFAVAAVLLAGCGTRADESEVRAGAAGDSTVTLDQASIDALAAAAQAAAPAGGAPVTAPGADPGTAPAGSTGSSPGQPSRGTRPAAVPKAGSGGTAATADTGRCTSPGAPVALGQIGTFSGLAGPIAGDGLTALAVWAKDVNARGGLACHPVTLYVRDDGGDPARAAAAVKELLGRGVVAFVGNLTALTQQGFKPEIEKNCVPAVGIDFGLDWSTRPCFFPQGGGWNESIAGLVAQAKERKHSRLGLLYCVEINTCSSIGKDIGAAADREGVQLVYSSAISLTQTDYTAQCQNAKNAQVEELVVAMEGSAMARLARSCLALGYKPLLVGAAFAINPKQAEDPRIRELGLAAINSNAPWFATDQPGLRAYQAALRTYAPQIVSSGITLQMFAAGRLLEAGVANLGSAARNAPLTSAQILAGLNKIKNETLGGLTAPLDFTIKGKPRSSGCVYLTMLGPPGWTTPDGTKPLCPKGIV
jgi:branched-chain amino acid transport system substrate-binding protein